MFVKLVIHLILVAFFFSSIGPVPDSSAQTMIDLPPAGMMVNRSLSFEPLELKGILVNAKDPLRFDFLVDKGDSALHGQPLKNNINRLAKYFLTCLTVPEDDLWVNLSPYEKDRIVPGNFGITLMGKDLLEQDYLLKQIMASLSYPENNLGKRFWQSVYRKSYELYGTTNIPVNTFNKVWIVPDRAQVYAQGNSAFVVNSRLDVMLEADYNALVHHSKSQSLMKTAVYAQVFRDVILPQLRQEINEGKNFAVVRQVYNAMILATWYKRHLKDSLLGRMYIGRNKVIGVDVADRNAKEKIFQQYLKAYKKCVYNYIREDYDSITGQTIARKYVSGGMYFSGFGAPGSVYTERSNPQGMKAGSDLAMATIDLSAINSRGSIVQFPYWKAEVTDTHPFHQVLREAQDLSDRAMFVPKFLRPLVLSLAMGIGGLMISPANVSAAAPVHSDTVSGLSAQIVQVDGQIKQREEKIHEEIFQFKQRDRAHDMHAAEISMRQGRIRYDEGILKKLISKKQDLSREIAVIESIKHPVTLSSASPDAIKVVSPIVKAPVQQLAGQMVSSAVSSGVQNHNILPLPAPTSTVTTAPAVIPSVAKQISPNPPQEKSGIFTLLTPLANTNISVGAPPPPPDSAKVEPMSSSSTWPTYAAAAVLGLGIGFGTWWSKRKVSKKMLSTAPKMITRQAVSTGLVIESSSEPAPMTADEKILLPGLRAKLQTLISENEPSPAASLRPAAVRSPKIESKTTSSRSDALAWLSAMALAIPAYGYDPVSLIATALILPVINAAYSTSNVWIHEIGHAFAAAVAYPLPKFWKKSFSLSNLSGNFSFEQWKRLFIARLRGKVYHAEDPYFSFPASGVRDWFISRSGLAATIGANLIAAASALHAAFDHVWLMPFLGVIGANGYSSIKAAWVDLKGSVKGEAGERKYPCGISMHSQLGKRMSLAFMGDDTSIERIKDMIATESDRGRHQVGVLSMRKGKDGKTKVVVEKAIEYKRGPGSDAVDSAISKLKSSLPPISADEANGEEYMMDTFIGHNRLASGGVVEEPAAHPHVGPRFEKVLWTLSNGALLEGKSMPPQLDVEVARPRDLVENDQSVGLNDTENVTAGAAHNGDSDEYRPLDSDRYLGKDGNLDELRAFAMDIIRFKGDLPPGDSPVIPLLIQFHLTQGNADASVNFAHVISHHKMIDEIGMDLLTEQEEMFAGEIFDSGIRKFAPVLTRPGFKDSEKTLRDLYVSKKMVEENPGDEQLKFQFTVLEELKKYLVNAYKKEAAAGNLSEKMTQYWRGVKGEKALEDFVELAMYKFFTGDREAACKEFQERSKGTYGLAVKVSTDLNGLTLISRKLGMVWGVNLEKGYLDASSDPYALLKKYKNGDQLEKLMYLDPKGRGEFANFQISRLSGKLHAKVFSFERNSYISDDEMFEREYPLNKSNRYYEPLFQYDDKNKRVMTDLDILTPALARLEESFDEKNSLKPDHEQAFNYQSTREVFKHLLARWFNEQFNEKMFKGGEYKAVFLRVNKAVKALAKECSSSNLCSAEHKEFLNSELQATAENSLLMAVIFRWLSDGSLKLAGMRIDGEINQKEAHDLIPQFIQTRSDHIVKLLNIRDLGRIYKYWDYQRKNPPSGKEKIGLLFAGDENSDNGPRNAQDIWDALLPNLPKRFVGSHELLDYKSLSFDVSSPAVTLLTSKAGGNFNTMQALDVMINAVGKSHVWGVTSRPDSPLSVTLGQRLRPESVFNGHLFYTGDHYSSQTQSASESLTSALHNLLAINVALELEKYCPGEHPFGLNLTPHKIAYLTRLKHEMMLKDAKRITGRDEEGLQVISPVHQALTKRGIYWASRLWETPAVTWIYRAFVYGIFLYGAPVHILLSAMGHTPGPVFQSLSGFFTATADFMVAMIMPLLLTLSYRKMLSYTPWVRLGPPANINLIGLNANPDIQKMLGRVLLSRSFASWSSQFHASTYQKAIAELGPAMNRGSWLVGHLGGTGVIQRKAKGAFKQLKVTRTGIFGTKLMRTGAISFTTSRGAFEDPNGVVSDSNIDLGGTEFLPPGDEDMVRVYNIFDAWGATLAFKVEASVMADTLTFGGRAWDPSRKVNNALSLTTESGQPPPEKLPLDTDSAQIAGSALPRKGGIDMNSRLMDLKVTGDAQNRLGAYDKAVPDLVINGVIPKVSQIVTVTPEMLKTMLGTGYLN